MAICERHNCFIILKTNFWVFEFVFGAKVIYCFYWIQIWRKFWRARTQNILPPMPKNHDFWVFTAMWESARAARQNFFRNVIFMIKSRCNFFCLVITQKANFLEQFEVWIFFENPIFSTKIENFEILKNFNFFLGFFMKNRNIQKHLQQRLSGRRMLPFSFFHIYFRLAYQEPHGK